MAEDILLTLVEIRDRLGNFVGVGGEIPGDTLLDMTAKIDGIRVAIETRSVAEVVGQNTNFSDLTLALAQLDLSCPPIVMRTTPFCMEDETEPLDSTEFEDPPEPWSQTYVTPGTTAYYSRKCNIANQIVDGIVHIFSQLDAAGVDNLSLLGASVVVGLFAAIVTVPAAGPFSVLVGILGAVSSAILLMVAGGWDAGTVVTATNSNREDLVCALYESMNASTAVSDMMSIYNTAGLNAVEQQLLTLILTQSGAANNLYFERSDVQPAPNGLTDCAGCATPTCPMFKIIYGTQTGSSGDDYTFISQQITGGGVTGHWISIHFGQELEGSEACGPARDINIVSLSHSESNSFAAYRRSDTHFKSGAGRHTANWTQVSDSWDPFIGVQTDGSRTLTLFKLGTTQFTLVVNIV